MSYIQAFELFIDCVVINYVSITVELLRESMSRQQDWTNCASEKRCFGLLGYLEVSPKYHCRDYKLHELESVELCTMCCFDQAHSLAAYAETCID